MADIGNGYGSECHLLRFMGRHRSLLNAAVLDATGGSEVEWLDAPFDGSRTWLDGEWKGVDFLPNDDPARPAWARVWPRRGNPPNWDAVGRMTVEGRREWLLVEAKANIEEMRSSCKASPQGGRPLIERTLNRTKEALGVAPERDWLNGHYQFCNRIAALHFLMEHGHPARLLFLYFTGDRHGPGRTCPANADEWVGALAAQAAHVGLPEHHPLQDRVHKLMLDVTGSRPLLMPVVQPAGLAEA